ncbi:MAG: TetR/AcrR family transcriptional regulator [Actinobacteria bacterium]|nr:TetR/AcrR family transcriptional regulator [Actinomycetota bacterium]
MDDGAAIKKRPGGRSAQVRARVQAAVIELLADHQLEEVTIPRVAERAGVHQATLYRRWGNVAGLVDDIVAERVGELAPIPDTGTLRGDLELAAIRFAEVIAPLGGIMIRAAALATPNAESTVSFRTRASQLQAMLDRAAARGEKAPTLTELLEGITAPLYFHELFFGRPADAEHAKALVDRLLIYVEAAPDR